MRRKDRPGERKEIASWHSPARARNAVRHHTLAPQWQQLHEARIEAETRRVERELRELEERGKADSCTLRKRAKK